MTKVGTTWLHEVLCSNSSDAVCVSRLRRCGVILLGKTNMHEVRMGALGNNPNYGRLFLGISSNSRFWSLSSCSWNRCCRSLCDSSTVKIIGPIASSVEDAMLVYASILGSSPSDRIALQPPSPCLPNLKNLNSLVGYLLLGKYSKWFNDVLFTNISDTCNDIVNELSKTHRCEIVVPELLEMHTAHLVTMGTEMLHSISPYWEESGKGQKFTPDTRINIAVSGSLTASDYVSAQCLRRRMMDHHMEIFKKVDAIVTPTTGITGTQNTTKCSQIRGNKFARHRLPYAVFSCGKSSQFPCNYCPGRL